MASQKKRNAVLLPTETILALSATQRISIRSGGPSHRILPGLNSTTRTAETGKREDPFPYTNATWEPEPRCRACQTIAQLGMESLAGRTRAAWTQARERSGKRVHFQKECNFLILSEQESLHLFSWCWVDPEGRCVCAPNDQAEMVQVPQWEEAPPAVVAEAASANVMENPWRWTIRSVQNLVFAHFWFFFFSPLQMPTLSAKPLNVMFRETHPRWCNPSKISPVPTAIQFRPASGGGASQQGFRPEEGVA